MAKTTIHEDVAGSVAMWTLVCSSLSGFASGALAMVAFSMGESLHGIRRPAAACAFSSILGVTSLYVLKHIDRKT